LQQHDILEKNISFDHAMNTNIPENHAEIRS
jgi:hypothetical protein